MGALMHRGIAIKLSLALVTLLQAGCLRSSPYDTALGDDQRRLTSVNIGKLALTERPRVSASAPLTFAFVSDTHDGYDAFDRISEAINARGDIELTLHGGDLTDFGTQLEFLWAEESLATLAVPFLVAPGNHDGLANGRLLYADMFGSTNFDFAYAGIHFVVLNTNTLEWKLSEPDLDWFDAVVTSPGYAATIVLSHQPPASKPHLSDEVGGRMREILERGGVSLYLYGHIHRGLVLGTERSTIFAKTEAGLHGSWMIVHTDGSSYSFELCNFDACEPARAAEPETAG